MPINIAGATYSDPVTTSLAPTIKSIGARKECRSNRVLIVEDHLMIADMTEEFLLQHGYDVCGIARTVDEAVALGRRQKPDIAILDLRLADGGLGTEIAAQLDQPSKPGILYVTGNMSEFVLTADDGHACLNKPYRLPDLLQALEIVADLVHNDPPSRSFPRGFRVLPPAASA